MTLKDLRDALARIPSHVSEWTPTNIEEITWNASGEIIAEFDRSDEEQLREELKEANESRDLAIKESEEADSKREAAEAVVDLLRDEMAALKDPSENGESVLTYRDRAMKAEAKTAEWVEHVKDARRAVEEMQKELTALRKRKGVEPIFAHKAEFYRIIRELADSQANPFKERAEKLIAAVLADKQKELDEKIAKRANLIASLT